MESKKAQITLFVVVAILIVAAVSVVIYTRAKPAFLPSEVKPVEDYFVSCASDVLEEGILTLSEQGGYIEIPKLEAGSDYMPFQSQISFFGTVMPYWFYISGNNIYRKEVPTVDSMEKELEDYINSNIGLCSENMDVFETQGYSLTFEEAGGSNVAIENNAIAAEISLPLTIKYAGTTRRITKHSVKINSELGSMYNLAKKIYDSEQKDLFLEQYSIDVLTLNAPTTGADLSCVPKIWEKSKLLSSVKEALQNNLAALKVKGTYYQLQDDKNKYFVHDLGESVGDHVNFVYFPSFQTKFEVYPSEGEVMRADPVGFQEGIGALGLCYVPYHFVYNLVFPVIVQVYDKDYNLFQFPMLVVVDKNEPRSAEIFEAVVNESAVPEMCENKLTKISVQTSDSQGKPVEAEINYKCSTKACRIGKTSDGYLEEMFPQCVNGFIIAKAEGYPETKYPLSTVEEASAEIIMTPYRKLAVDVLLDSLPIKQGDSAVISLVSDSYSASIFYPTQKEIEIPEGEYNVSAYLFKQGEITIEGKTESKCIEVPSAGVMGVLGFKTEECNDITIDDQMLTSVVGGGGKTVVYFSEGDLSMARTALIDIPSTPDPKTVDDLMGNYYIIESQEINVELI